MCWIKRASTKTEASHSPLPDISHSLDISFSCIAGTYLMPLERRLLLPPWYFFPTILLNTNFNWPSARFRVVDQIYSYRILFSKRGYWMLTVQFVFDPVSDGHTSLPCPGITRQARRSLGSYSLGLVTLQTVSPRKEPSSQPSIHNVQSSLLISSI